MWVRHPEIARLMRELGEEIERGRLTALERHEIGIVLNMLGLLAAVTNAHAQKRLYEGLPKECQWRKR
jgi:hypothetical protein